mmetsp:Transcript_6297/g.19012  ORF Transcript_6297/g.19012 Transcript_6297/m.19012 type:complete len:244 (-) Transcript_6297:859-1590(-)
MRKFDFCSGCEVKTSRRLRQALIRTFTFSSKRRCAILLIRSHCSLCRFSRSFSISATGSSSISDENIPSSPSDQAEDKASGCACASSPSSSSHSSTSSSCSSYWSRVKDTSGGFSSHSSRSPSSKACESSCPSTVALEFDMPLVSCRSSAFSRIHLCRSSSSALDLAAISFVKHLRRKSSSEPDMSEGSGGLSSVTILYMAENSFRSPYGGFPVRSSTMVQPKLQMSDSVDTPVREMISGAIQ